MRLSVFTASTPDLPPAEAARAIAAAGYEGIEWRVVDQDPAPAGAPPGFWQGNLATIGVEEFLADPAAVRETARQAGLEISGIGAYAQHAEPELVDRLLAASAAAGADRMRVCTRGLDELEHTRYPELFATSRTEMREVADSAARHGVRALVELHPGTIVSSASAALRLLEGLDPRHVGVIHDLGNLVVEGMEDLRASVQMLGDLLAHVHVKNNRWVRDADGWRCEYCPVEDGTGDLDAFLAALRDEGYDDWITLEDFSTELPLPERLVHNRTLVRSAWERAAPKETR